MWLCNFVYGNPNFKKRQQQWREITVSCRSEGEPQLFIGDFNDILSQVEKVGLHPKPQNQVREFRNFVDSNALIDLELKGGGFTWFSNPRNGFVTRERIDMALGNWQWRMMYPHAYLSSMPATSSDHSPLILDLNPVHNVRRSFKFEAFWADHEDCENVVRRGWSKREPDGCEWGRLINKIKSCKDELRKWSYFAAKGEFQSRDNGNPSTSDARRELWKEIWKMKIPAKIKSFLWKAAHDIVPVNSNLFKKRIAGSPICQICNKEVETTEHALLLCEWTRAAWFGADCQCIPTIETVTEFGDWFMTIIQKIKSVGGRRKIEESIWKTRNQKVYQQQEINPSWTIKRAKLMENLFWRIAEKKINLKERQVQKGTREVRWRPPPADWIKANVDASFKKNTGKGAIAVVYRDNRGRILLGFTGLIQANSVTVAEALAIRQALIIANNLFMGKVLIESDNLKIIQAIKSKSPIGEAWAINQDIQLLLEQLPGRGITWTPREGNLLAHKVAREAELGNLHSNWSMQPPLEILRIMHNESKKQ
ncbi:hypothetical protein Ahy_B03g062308 [Arachis hypogaea]|uniref:RNase H type-1 domain-containing protein n=2 Tax=Arachis hypogaea TaxID=3818 RepID=A0A444ZTR9_ARAHY|nr:hypothetical protein Ahy_B03g062308 [Arachis hypogaea]